MLLLDAIDDHGPDWVRAIVEVRADSAFAGPAGVPSWAGLEYLAQCAGAYSGIEMIERGSVPGIALLLGTRRYTALVDCFEAGVRLEIETRVEWRDETGLVAFSGEIRCEGRELATADLKAYRPQDIRELTR